jgi:2-keto-4-pentenoate hydratase/2-oxohepta-3-ene-1,7-dioic acid hydratase in catechol pathway
VRLVSYKADGGWRSGIEIGGVVVDVRRIAEDAGWAAEDSAPLESVRAVLALARPRLEELGERAARRAGALEATGAARPRWDLHIGPPIPDPAKIVCLGLNYRDHAEEAGLAPPSEPMFFAKWANSLVRPDDAIVPPAVTEMVDYEAELAVVIGKRARNISSESALDVVAGAMAFNDVSARDLQLANQLWTGGKAIDTFGPCGPALVLLDELDDLQNLAIRTRVNGETVQDGNTASMIFGVADTIAFLSRIMTLEPGDIIATGTPAGIGNARDPKLFLRCDDVVEVEIEGIGTLRNRIAAPA